MVDSVVLIQQATGGDGCCGGVVNDDFIRMPEADEHGEHADCDAAAYRTLCAEYGDDLAINYVDPKNSFALVGYFARHWWARDITAREALGQLALAIKPGAWFCNGKWLNPDGEITGDAVCARIGRCRSRAGGRAGGI